MQIDWQQEKLEHLWEKTPHEYLGLHTSMSQKKVVRVYRPGASHIEVEVLGERLAAQCLLKEGVFECIVPNHITEKDYRIYHPSGLLAHDPYAFVPSLEAFDSHLFSRGLHYRLYELLGAHLQIYHGVAGTLFTVWAPNAKNVSLVADFNHWDGRCNPMSCVTSTGLWRLFVPGIGEGEKYKFEILDLQGKRRLKSDPVAYYSEQRPKTASIVFDLDRFCFTDQAWQDKQKQWEFHRRPLNIYEIHLGSWKRKGEEPLNYRTLAHELVQYCQEMGFSHVELLPITEHPLDESWGYQVTGFFAVTSRFGTPEDFQYFVNYLHAYNIGVILDWVPAHFPTDEHSLALLDGTCLYEHEDPRQGFHPHWQTAIFNYGRFEVSNFLIASALFWLDKMHVDGLRVDAVASMLYLDYGRKEGQWLPNCYGRHENLEAIEFLKHLNAVIHAQFPSAIVCAEESTAFTGVTHSLSAGGLGFDLKWNMGWMNDTLHYFSKDPLVRSHHTKDLTFGLLYAFSERFILPFSHDEVVHGKASLLSKMPGDDWQKFANIRLLLSYQICQPGKKLLFMGAEIGQWEEWQSNQGMPWHLLQYERHQKLKHCVQQMHHFYHAHPALWESDFDPCGFEWVDFSDQHNATISYLRRGGGELLLCIHHFTPSYVPDYFLRLPNVLRVQEVFTTDREEYGGSGKMNLAVDIVQDPYGQRLGIQFQLAPLATMIFEVTFVH